MILAQFGRQLIFKSVRCLGTRKDGLFRKGLKVPKLPIKGPRDYDYWRRLKRKPKNPKDKSPRTNKLCPGRPAAYKPKKKSEIKPDEDDLTTKNENQN